MKCSDVYYVWEARESPIIECGCLCDYIGGHPSLVTASTVHCYNNNH